MKNNIREENKSKVCPFCGVKFIPKEGVSTAYCSKWHGYQELRKERLIMIIANGLGTVDALTNPEH